MGDEKRRIKIAFVTPMDPQDKRAWSGILFHTAQALQKYCGDVSYIGQTNSNQHPARKAFYKKMRFLLKKYSSYNPFFSIGRKYFVCNYRIYTAKKFSKIVNPWLAAHSFDVIVAPASTTEIAFVNTDLPIVLVEDATFESLHNYYPQYSNLPKNSVRQMNLLSNLAIRKASLLVYASGWAAQSAIDDYHADPQQVHVALMGANFENPPSREIIEQKQKSQSCRLLFIGFDWQRKGGDIAFETLLKLEEEGIEAELIVCGCVPPRKYSHERMKVIPYLDKNDPAQYKELEQLYLSSDFLLLPTRNECFGLVFCEANAYGLPVITTHTGGVPEVVIDGKNGFTLPLSARGAEYARKIASIYRDDLRYAELVKTSRDTFDDRLNWDAWGKTVNTLITEMLEHSKAGETPEVSTETTAGA
jgi:glycosyltransferase involved in cell wall biosynthesis